MFKIKFTIMIFLGPSFWQKKKNTPLVFEKLIVMNGSLANFQRLKIRNLVQTLIFSTRIC